jgi:hypothetical protein
VVKAVLAMRPSAPNRNEDMAASTPPDFGTGLRAALDARGNLDVPPMPLQFAELLQAESVDEPRPALPIAALAPAA